MTLISFPGNTQFDFALQFLQGINASRLGVIPRVQSLELEARNPIIERLLQRMCDDRPVIFPYLGNKFHSWIITATTRHQLDGVLTQVSRFIVPTYAEFDTENRLSQLKMFKANGNRLQQLGLVLFPAGYYSWRSPVQYLDTILRHLAMWMDVEEQCPAIEIEDRPTYRHLHDLFQAALTAANWQEAGQCLREMQRLYLITAENLAFLEVQLLAQQQRWQDIWHRTDFSDLARMRVPRAVRAALLTAFHCSMLLPLEQENRWQEALDTFNQARSALGLLLTGRFGITQVPVIQVFTYLAAADQDDENLADLRKMSDAKEVEECIDQMYLLLGRREIIASIPTIVENNGTHTDQSLIHQARIALADFNYDSALHFIRQAKQPIDKAVLLMQVAFHSGDIPVAEEAVLSYWELASEEQSHLEERYPFVHLYLKELLAITQNNAVAEPGVPDTPSLLQVQNWLEWFDLAETKPDDLQLIVSLDRLMCSADDGYWSEENLQLLNEKLLSFIIDPRFTSPLYRKRVIQHLVDRFLQSPNFPQEGAIYADLYETLYIGLLEKKEVNLNTGFALLRLAEAILRNSPSRCVQLSRDLIEWCKFPIPALENWALEAFDLCAEYGLASGLLVSWYREWVFTLLGLPTNRERTNLETWLIFGNWIQPGSDILRSLEQSIARAIEDETDNPVAALSKGYRIGIFTLRKSAAQQAKQLLLERNNTLDVRICTETDLNESAKAIAQNSDLVVVVTSCISHALTYGINPYLKNEPAYPQSSGASSIVRAVEEYLGSVKQIRG